MSTDRISSLSDEELAAARAKIASHDDEQSEYDQDLIMADLNSSDFSVPRLDMTAEKLEAELKQCKEVVHLYLTNDWRKGYAILRAKQRDGFFYMSGVAINHAVIGGFGVNKERLNDAMELAVHCIEFIKAYRKKNTGLVFKANPNSYTDVECAAEQAYSEAMIAYAMLTVGVDQSVMGFIKGAIRMRTGFNGIKHCERILKERTNWENDHLRREFECGIIGCLGVFDMVISFFPRRFITLLQLAGFSADRMNGLSRLEHSASLRGTIRHLAALGAVVLYHIAGEFLYGLGEPDIERVVDLINGWLAENGSGPAAEVAQALLAALRGDIDTSHGWFNQFMTHRDIPRKMHFATFLFQSCTYALQWDWHRALDCMTILKDHCKWSRALFAYSWAVFASMLVDEDGRDDLRPKIAEVMASVPSLKRHFGGKKAFHEMLVIEKSKLFAADVSRMVLAPFDLVYLGNGFEFASYNPENLNRIIEKFEAKRSTLYRRSRDADIYAYLTFMKAAALSKTNGRRHEAHKYFLEILDMENELSYESHLVPQSCYEIGRLYRAVGDKDQARRWLSKAGKYSGYLTETMIKYRATIALESLSK